MDLPKVTRGARGRACSTLCPPGLLTAAAGLVLDLRAAGSCHVGLGGDEGELARAPLPEAGGSRERVPESLEVGCAS